MSCPVCQSKLEKIVLDKELEAQKCDNHGIWIPALNYWRWLATQQISYPPKINEGEFEATPEDSRNGKICGSCGQLLYRYGVGHGVSFHIDQCPKCSGIWLDNGEWEVLIKKNLHNAMHFMFSDPWQNKVNAEEEQANYESLLISKFGEELFEKVREFKAVMKESNQESLIVTYLQNRRD